VKARLWWLIGVLAMGCASHSPAAPPKTETSKEKTAIKVYYQGQGPDHDVRRFRKFLEIALEDSDLVATDSSRDADAIVKMRFSHEQRTENLYAPVVWITLATPDRQVYTAKSCNSLSTSSSIFNERIESLSTVKLPANWKKHGSAFAIYISDSEMQGTGELLMLVKRRLAEDGYRITGMRGDADATLQSIKVQKLGIPMRVDAYYADEEVLDRNSNRIMYSFGREHHDKGTGHITYLGVEQGIKPENLPCNTTFSDQIGGDPDWRSASSMAQQIRKYFDGKAHKAHSD
jgi:hypothetical protein